MSKSKFFSVGEIRDWVAANCLSDPELYQLQGAYFMLKHRYVILGDEMGLGKSLQALIAACMRGGKILIVSPSMLTRNWMQQIDLHLAYPPKKRIFGSGFADSSQIPDDLGIAITTFRAKSLTHLMAWADTVIVDEVQAYKNEESQRSWIFHTLCWEHRPEDLYCLSGTIIENGTQEWYSPLCLMSYCPHETNGLNVQVDFPNKVLFANKFAYHESRRTPSGYVDHWSGCRNVPILKRYLDRKYLRRCAKDHLNLPEMNSEVVFIDKMKADPDLLAEYEMGHIRGTGPTAKSKSALRKTGFTAMLAMNLLENSRPEDGPVIVFTDHVESARDLGEKLGGVPVIDGSVSMPKRFKLQGEFQENQHDVIVATIQSMGVGVTLTASNRVIFNDENWVPGKNDQALKRIHRIGQTKTCFVYRVMGSPQDLAISERLKGKRETIEQVS